MSHSRSRRSRRSSRNKSRYKAVPRSKAKVGDIKSVSSDGKSRRYWTSKDLGIKRDAEYKSRINRRGSSSDDPNKYKYSDGKRSYETKADYDDARNNVYANRSSSSSKKQSGPTQAQRDQLEQIRQTLLGLRTQLQNRQGSSSSGSSAYQGPSIVDYLDSIGQDSSRANRNQLAAQYGIQNYQGTAAQNTQLLNTLRAGSVSSNSGGVPSSAIGAGYTTQDVLDKRNEIQGVADTEKNKEESLSYLENIANQDPFEGVQGGNPLNDPDSIIARYFSGNQDYTKAERERDRLLSDISDTTSEYYQNREKGLKNAYREFGVDAKTEQLAQIQKEMAERQKKLREDTQRLETDAEFRGVSRDFANDQREKVRSTGAFDLANLAIVESAYAGDLDRSRELAQSLVDDQFNVFTGQIESYKAQLQALMPQLNEDQKRRALAIELALDERTRRIEQVKADQELKYEYATLAAEMNAPLDVTRSIINAGSADEAFMLAAPYMREKQVASTGSSGATRGGTTSTNVAGYQDIAGISPFNTPLSDLDYTSSKTTNRELENAIRGQFSDEMSSQLFTNFSQEQVRDWLAKYDAYQRSVGMNTDPGIFANAYMYSIGKTPNFATSIGLPAGSFEIDSEDRIRPEDDGKYDIRRVGGVLYAVPKTGATTSSGSTGTRSAY